MFAGQSASDPTVCAVPQLSGVNGCSVPLTLPKRAVNGEPTVVQPGEKIAYPIPSESVLPGVTVVDRGPGAADYVLAGTLGAQDITLTVPVHHD